MLSLHKNIYICFKQRPLEQGNCTLGHLDRPCTETLKNKTNFPTRFEILRKINRYSYVVGCACGKLRPIRLFPSALPQITFHATGREHHRTMSKPFYGRLLLRNYLKPDFFSSSSALWNQIPITATPQKVHEAAATLSGFRLQRHRKSCFQGPGSQFCASINCCFAINRLFYYWHFQYV